MIKVYFASKTRAVRIIWLLEELNLPYELHRLNFSPKDLKSEEYRKVHPLGRVPVFEDGNVLIYESGAIIEYILTKYRNGGLKPTAIAETFPKYLQWFHYCEGMIMPPINTIMVQKFFLAEEKKIQQTLEQAERLLINTLKPVNFELSAKNFLIGNFSAADIMTGHACYQAETLGYVDKDNFPFIYKYIEKLKSRQAFDKAINL